jgi:subtilisin
MSKILAKSVDAKRPNYIIFFKEASERNVATMSTALKREVPSGLRLSSSFESFAAADGGSPAKVYAGLGVATADLTASELKNLEKSNEVEMVLENEVRYLPPKRTGAAEAAAESAPLVTPAAAYLRGMRDAAELALRFVEGRSENEPSSERAAGPLGMGPLAQRLTWGLRAMGLNAPNAPTGRGVRVAVLDTGIDLSHPDLMGKVVEGSTAVSLVAGVSVQDVNGHGTHCAGTVAGPLQSIGGIRYGVAPNVELMVGKVFNNDSEPAAFDDDILEAIEWADQNGARIINMSLGSSREVGEEPSPLYENLARRLLNRTANSVLIVAAAGNDSDRPFSVAPVGNPAAAASIMAVAAVDRAMRIASFSCRQMDHFGEVNVSAPGVDVLSAMTGGGFESLNGTSMAAPHVAGLAALYLESNPALTASQLFRELMRRARRLGDARDFGAGLARL